MPLQISEQEQPPEMRPLLIFDDAGASNEHPAKGVTVGDIRAWHDGGSAVFAWMREPDHVENATLEWLTDWLNRRPLSAIPR